MGRYHKYKPPRIVKMPLAQGGTYDFYEPDHLLSEQMTPKQALPMEIAIRETAWNYYRVLGFLPNPSEVLRKLGKDISEYKYLLEDSHVNGCMSSRKAGTLSLKWTLDQNGCASRQYSTVKAILDSWNIDEIMGEMIHAVFFGYQPCEVVWKRQNGLVLPEKFVPKDPDWFRFSDINELRYLTKRNMVTGEPVPNYKFITTRYHASYERPYGRPLGSVVYWAVKFRHAGLKFWTEFAEKFGQPWIKATYPLGTQQARVMQMLDMLNTTIQDGVVAVPSEFNVETIDVNKTSSGDIFNQFLEHMNEEIAIGILGQTLTTKMDKAGGSFAAAKVHGTIRKDLVEEDRKMVERAFNELISWIYEINWNVDQVKPVFQLVSAPTPGLEDGQLAAALYETGIRFTKEYYQNRFNLLETEFNIPSAEEVAKQAMASKGMSPEANIPDATGTAENKSTYDSTKEAVNRLTRR